MCGLDVLENQLWYIWAHEFEGRYHTSICSRSAREGEVSRDFKKLLKSFTQRKNKTKWFDKKGVLRGQGRVKNKAPTGYWKFYYRGGDIRGEGNFKNGLKGGIWKFYCLREKAYRRLHKIAEDAEIIAVDRSFSRIVCEIVEYSEGKIVARKQLIGQQN